MIRTIPGATKSSFVALLTIVFGHKTLDLEVDVLLLLVERAFKLNQVNVTGRAGLGRRITTKINYHHLIRS